MTRYHRQRPGCCAEHRLAMVHQGFDHGRRHAIWDDLDVDAGTRRHAWRNAIIGAAIVAVIVITGLITGPGSY